ncbi:glycosyltransferase [Salinimicrobium oceani]|uniref:Glycosyltransferase n=1 Tax=Salinimicrobium oceani TaxID=2722702 RepID=A0ABX1D4R4_9FLAO|nr:glycosyltransferase family 2 protein [Salinimicrobium oceani]NJW54178.1 glycosyltransferase [Salinimicrobium oceani]
MKTRIKAPTKVEEWIIKIMILLGLFSVVYFLFFFFQPQHRGNIFLFTLLCITMLYSILKKLYMWYNYGNISVPEVPQDLPKIKVDILTTYFPGEPYQMIVTTLEAITKITYPHTAYLCDEANDPYLKRFCEENGIIHVTRDNRKDAKAGNINNALRKVATGEICVVLDPDHIPEPNFLDPIIPFFSDPEIGFVQIVQAYYNIKDTLVARGAAEQTFQFYGPMMMTLHSYGTVNAIGANCVFRRAALDSIGGHAPGLCEDMHTAMLLYSKGWKSVYLPEVLAKGLAPSNLTTYFKQQLKWARGTFDLLFKVYPKVFNQLTTRQKIHFGILPLHYLSGVMYLINFLIPIIALVFSITPWEGNLADFFLALLPVAFSAMLIRTFIQKWVIEKEERGFHLTGGLLQINTWWIYILGLVYTIINKNVLYLPTPKQSEFNTNLKIVIPNIIVAGLSVSAIIYGLNKDLTPFSIFMAGFALFNTLIMLFGMYLTIKTTNQNRILRANLGERTVKELYNLKSTFRKIFHGTFTITRKAALPLLAAILIFAYGYRTKKEVARWKTVIPAYHEKISGKYFGIYHPPRDTGTVDLDEINAIEARQDLNFDIISLYLAWSNASVEKFPHSLLNNIAAKNAIPLITWEPWAAEIGAGNAELENDRRVFKHIAEGYYDNYIRQFADHLAKYNRPIFLRFAHEFDNPQYPWSASGGNSPADFKAAWRHVHDILTARGANEVMMVWNPWKPKKMQQYYPGDKYVDWVGLTILNYQELNESGAEMTFDELYLPFKERLFWFTRKPVMLAEFGSLDLNENRENWLKNSMAAIEEKHSEISAVVLFNSAFDDNIPTNDFYDKQYLNWTIDSLQMLGQHFKDSPVYYNPIQDPLPANFEFKALKNIKGIEYKKAQSWQDNYYVVTRETLLQDLKKARAAGINTLKFRGGTVYDYNLLKYTSEKEFKVVYELDLGGHVDFAQNALAIYELEEEILQKVRQLKDHSNIIAYSFNPALQSVYSEPMLFYQKQGFYTWLKNVANEIRKLDPNKALILELPWTASTPQEVSELSRFLPVDSYGLHLGNIKDLEMAKAAAETFNAQVIISSIPVEGLSRDYKQLSGNVILENWQDERYSHRISFDGLIDFSGRAKQAYFIAESHFRVPVEELSFQVRILKPAYPLLPGETQTYHASIFKNNEWLQGAEALDKYKVEWMLIKNDIFGNPLAARSLGSGNSLPVKIPNDYENYQLLLSVQPNDSERVMQSLEKLNTPIYSAGSY